MSFLFKPSKKQPGRTEVWMRRYKAAAIYLGHISRTATKKWRGVPAVAPARWLQCSSRKRAAEHLWEVRREFWRAQG